MMGIADVASHAANHAASLTILGIGFRADLSDCIRCSFLLHDDKEGTVCGFREFSKHTVFTCMHDFIDELWNSNGLFLVVGK